MGKKKEQAGGASAAAVVEAPPPVVQEEAPLTISQKIFPDFKIEATEETPAEEAPAETPEPAADPGKEVPPPVETPEPAPEPPAPAVPEVLDIAAFQGKKVRVKVDGEEIDVPAESLVQNFQLASHLNNKGRQLNEQKRALEELRKELLGTAQKQTDAIEEAVEEGQAPAEVKALQAELVKTREQLAQIQAATSDIVFEKNVARIDGQVKAELGFDDFRSYVPKIQKFIASQLADPKNPTPQEIALYDTPTFYLSKYQEMKLRDLKGALSQPAPAPAPAPAPIPAAPPAPKLTRIVPVEPAGGAIPSQIDEAKEQRLEAAFSRAKKSGSMEDWAEYHALKRSI